jgi:hypothetical protein
MRAPLTIAAAQPRSIPNDVRSNALEHADVIRTGKACVVVFRHELVVSFEPLLVLPTANRPPNELAVTSGLGMRSRPTRTRSPRWWRSTSERRRNHGPERLLERPRVVVARRES